MRIEMLPRSHLVWIYRRLKVARYTDNDSGRALHIIMWLSRRRNYKPLSKNPLPTEMVFHSKFSDPFDLRGA